MAFLGRRENKVYHSSPFQALEESKKDFTQKGVFTYNDNVVATVFFRGDEVMLVSSPVFDLDVPGRMFWTKGFTTEFQEMAREVSDIDGYDEGFFSYIEVFPHQSRVIADYYRSKEISIMLWLDGLYRSGSGVKFTSEPTLFVIHESRGEEYKGRESYSSMTIKELEEKVREEEALIEEMNTILGVGDLSKDEYETLYFSNDEGLEFDSFTPYDDDARNFTFEAMRRESTLESVRTLSSGFLWSEVLKAFAVNRGLIEVSEDLKESGLQSSGLPVLTDESLTEEVSEDFSLPDLPEYEERETEAYLFEETVPLNSDTAFAEEDSEMSAESKDIISPEYENPYLAESDVRIIDSIDEDDFEFTNVDYDEIDYLQSEREIDEPKIPEYIEEDQQISTPPSFLADTLEEDVTIKPPMDTSIIEESIYVSQDSVSSEKKVEILFDIEDTPIYKELSRELGLSID